MFLLLSATILAVACTSNLTSNTNNTMTISNKEELTFPLGVSNDAYAQYFSGQSYLADLVHEV